MAMSLMAFNGMAQSTSNAASAANKTENTQCANKECKGKKGDKQKGDRKDGKKMGQKNRQNPFEGLNLTEAQKTQLQQLDAKRKAEREKKMEARKAEKEQMKAKKQNAQMDKKDLAARKAEKQQNDSIRKAARVADMREYLVQVKEIIGPDNYVKFLENVYVSGGMKGDKAVRQVQKGGKQHMAQGKSGKGSKMGKAGKQGQNGKQGKDGKGRQNKQAQNGTVAMN